MSASDRAKSRMERILRLHEQIDALKLDIRQVYAEEKADGGDKTAMGAAVSYIRKRDKEGSDLADREAMADVYVAAYDAPRTHTHTREVPSYSQSGLTYAKEKGRGDAGSSNGRTADFGSANAGSNPAPVTSLAGELTDDQESDQPHEADVPATAAVASDEKAAQDDVGATASSTNSPEGANDVPAQDGGGTALDASHGGKSNAARPASVDAHVNDGRLAGEVSVEAVTVVGDESGTLDYSKMDRATEGSFETGSEAAENARKAIPAGPEDGSVSHAGAGEIPATHSHSPAAIPLGAANSAGGAPSSPAPPARHSDEDIPAFLRRDEGRGYTKHEASA